MSRSKQCIILTKDRLVKVSGEHRRSAVFHNSNNATFRLIRFDGCLVQNETAADWIVCKADQGDLVLEFKGRDVGHALKQVVNTLALWRDRKERIGNSPLGALIVCVSQKPAFSAQRQRAERMLRRDYSAKLSVVSGNCSFQFNDLVSL